MNESLSISEKYLLNVKEVMEYLGLGENRVRELLKNPASTFTVCVGKREFANRKLLEKYIDSQTGNH